MREKWQSLPQEYRDIMTEAVKTATAWCDEANLKQEQEAITFLKEQGLTVIEPDLNAFMEYSENYYLNDKDMVKRLGYGIVSSDKGFEILMRGIPEWSYGKNAGLSWIL